MKYFVLVQISQSEAHLYEEAPYFQLVQWSVHLFLQKLTKVTVLAVFHNDANTVTIAERVIVLDHVLTVDFRHDSCLEDGFALLMSVHLPRVDDLHDVGFAVLLPFDHVDNAE